MKDLIYLAASTIILAPAVVCILSNSAVLIFAGLLYCVWLSFQSRTKYGKRLVRHTIRAIIQYEKSLGIW